LLTGWLWLQVELRGPGDRGGGIGFDVDDGDLQVLEPSNDRYVEAGGGDVGEPYVTIVPKAHACL
jgi:hypothetical protein